MKISKERLQRALQAVQPGLSSRNSKSEIERSDSFIFTKNEVLTYNDRICVCYPLKNDLDCALSSKELYGIVAGCGNDIEIERKDESVFIESDNGRTAELAVFDQSIITNLVKSLKLQTIKKKLKNIPEDFLQAIKFCIFSVSKDASYPVLTCIYVNDDIVISSDDFRISKYVMNESIEDSFLLPSKSAMELLKFDIQKYYVSDDWVYFQSKDKAMFCSNIMQGDYPDYNDDFIFKGKNLTLPKELKQYVENAVVMTDGNFDLDRRLTITLDNNELILRAEKSDIGWMEDTIDLKYKGTKKQFAINPHFFSDILERSSRAKLGDDRILFINKNSKHLISLFVDNEEKDEEE